MAITSAQAEGQNPAYGPKTKTIFRPGIELGGVSLAAAGRRKLEGTAAGALTASRGEFDLDSPTGL